MTTLSEREPLVQLHLALRGTPWAQATTNEASAWAKGYAFLGDRLLDAQVLAALLLPPQGMALAEHVGHLLEELNGNWALIAQAGETTFAAVDQVRSIPLFYGAHKGHFYLNDLALVPHTILHEHYGLWQVPAEMRPVLLERIRARGIDGPVTNAEEAAALFQLWEWQERHSKFIVNSVRAYEFWGYEWRLPLWDKAHAAYWQRIPLHVRRGKRLFIRYQTRLWERMGLPWPPSTRDVPPLQRQTHRVLRRWLERANLLEGAIGANRLFAFIRQYYTHPWAVYGLHSLPGHLQALGWRGILHPPPGLCIHTLLIPMALAQWSREGLVMPTFMQHGERL